VISQTRPVRSRKKAANLTVDGELLDAARRMKLNLSQVFEAGLTEAVRQKEREAWLKKNRAALDAYNQYVEKHGVFSDGLRSF
jgi:antitoxin CcdA